MCVCLILAQGPCSSFLHLDATQSDELLNADHVAGPTVGILKRACLSTPQTDASKFGQAHPRFGRTRPTRGRTQPRFGQHPCLIERKGSSHSGALLFSFCLPEVGEAGPSWIAPAGRSCFVFLSCVTCVRICSRYPGGPGLEQDMFLVSPAPFCAFVASPENCCSSGRSSANP